MKKKLIFVVLLIQALFLSPANAAITFDGTNDALKTASTLNIGTNVCSVSFWLYWNAFANDDHLALELSANASTTNSDTFQIDPNSSSPANKFKVVIHGTGSSSLFRIETFTRPSAAAWHHYVFYFDNSTTNGDIRIWVDAVEQSTTISTDTKTDTGNFLNTTLYFMSRATTSLRAAGIMSEFAIFNRLLTASEVAQLYGGGTVGKYLPNSLDRSAIIMYLPMDEAPSGTVNSAAGYVKDVSGNANNVTQANDPAYSAEPANLPYKTRLFKGTYYASTLY